MDTCVCMFNGSLSMWRLRLFFTQITNLDAFWQFKCLQSACVLHTLIQGSECHVIVWRWWGYEQTLYISAVKPSSRRKPAQIDCMPTGFAPWHTSSTERLHFGFEDREMIPAVLSHPVTQWPWLAHSPNQNIPSAATHQPLVVVCVCASSDSL